MVNDTHLQLLSIRGPRISATTCNIAGGRSRPTMAESFVATGRGQFFQSFMDGLTKNLGRTGGTRQPDQCRQAEAERCRGSPGGGALHRHQERTTFVKPLPEEIVLERLPSEILIKILSNLDAASLLSLSYVNKIFHQLANDDVVWYKIYTAAFSVKTWRLKSTGDATKKAEPKEHSSGGWKKKYLWNMGGQELSTWRKELTDVSPFTGLPQQAERILRNHIWELKVCDPLGRVVTLDLSRVSFFSTSATLCWSGSRLIQYPRISSVQLFGVRKEALKGPRPRWCSLICKWDAKTCLPRFLGRDRVIQVMLLLPGFILGVWRGSKTVAFVMISLHLHRLVERSLLGSPICSYWEPVEKWPGDMTVRTYALHFVLHNTVCEIMSVYFHPLICRPGCPVRGCQVELQATNGSNMSRHRLLPGHIKLPWKSKALEGSVEMCCVMVMTLLEEAHKPMWCVSMPVSVKMVRKPPCSDYDGDHFLLAYKDAQGTVRMTLVRLKEQGQFFVVNLVLSLFKEDRHLSTRY
ncbi:F-box only protein 15-like isoform X3 [Nerophis ophidion]|uniref:F-box only protein 15-like isoform X3 n=1 Tax=Nerophis ophidion TaxID=159077 RepID=UPI002AE030CA|nr:F-box only protein 15-like isoform X3 [Nerophis ophidion]